LPDVGDSVKISNMLHYVQYHHPAQGADCTSVAAGEFLVGTNKRTRNLLGQRLWVICGEGRPRHYWLCKSYLIDRVELADDPEFRLFLYGETGSRFQPPILLNDLPWFPAFVRSQSNFSFGLNRIQPGFVVELEVLAQQAGPTPDPV
jgi:hypothetical protein